MSEIVTVKVVQGQLRGREATTKSGHTYYSFQGIPYAKPPVGALRFKAPQPPAPWEGMRDALVEGPVCAQIDILKKAFKGEEDCLFLNVYTPKLPKSPAYKPMAVMVWLHGGGFAIGDGNSWLYGPDFLITEGIVLVTLNYRLGPLGFLCLEDNIIPGNAGLKDQVMALRWVQQNISKFGGDPHNVTLFGVSSGASCIHYLMLSPMAAGLFHRAIIQSGSALNPWAFDEAPREKAFRLGAALGCHTQDSVQLAQYLRSVPIQRLVECIEKSKPKGWHPKRRGLCNFAPSVECGIAEDEETFLDEHPIALMKHGRFHKVPLIIGVTSHEGLLFLKEIMTVPSQLEFYNKNFESVICKLFYSGISENKWKEISEKVKKFYFGDKPLCQDTLLEYVDLNTDVQFVTPICFFVKMVLEHTPFPVYCYKFSFDGRLAYLKQLLGLKQFPGVCHSDEIGYLFRVGHMDHELDPDSPEARARQRMVRMWTNFAKMGRPIPKRDFLLNTVWEPIILEDLRYLNIDTDISMQREIHKGHLQFWEELMYNNL